MAMIRLERRRENRFREERFIYTDEAKAAKETMDAFAKERRSIGKVSRF